jgi:2-oxoglutarate dehydrogenase E2 component (dihydrolipoamide succinyltransferase)
MAQDVLMPQMGESITEGTVTTWLKKVGDRVERDEPLFEISTDKVDAEIPSPVSGVLLEIKVAPGTTVPINTVVAVLGEGAVATAAAPVAEPTASPAPQPVSSPPAKPPASPPPAAKPVAAQPVPRPAVAAEAPKPARGGEEDARRPKSSPLVRKIAAEHQLDVARIPGTGQGGRVTKKDILTVLEGGAAAPVAAAPAVTAVLEAAELPAAYRPRVLAGDRVEDLSTMRVKIAEHMVLSRRTSAHVNTIWEVDFQRIAELRQKNKQLWAEQHGVPLTFTAFIMKAVVDALKAFPVVNASTDGKKVIYHRDVHLGLAVALDWGLIVPVIHNAQELNLLGLARRAADLAERARSKKLRPDEVQNGTFTITNPGLYGPMFNMPVINQPQVAILGVGAIEKRPVVRDDAIAIRTMSYLALTFDHRIVDGADADQFMAQVKKGLEQFDESGL